jgi:hypothetical protein
MFVLENIKRLYPINVTGLTQIATGFCGGSRLPRRREKPKERFSMAGTLNIRA